MRSRLLAATLAAAATVALPATAGAQAAPRPCPTVAPGALCTTLTVPLDHSGAVPGTQPLSFAVLPATGAKAGTLLPPRAGACRR